jgi:hypothetical protein
MALFKKKKVVAHAAQAMLELSSSDVEACGGGGIVPGLMGGVAGHSVGVLPPTVLTWLPTWGPHGSTPPRGPLPM